MSSKLGKESLVLLINVGVTNPGTQSSSLLEKAKNIVKRIIEKKIFLRPKDEIAVILMGSFSTKNSLNTEHVEEFINFQVPNWDMIQKITNLQGTNYCSNWVEALVATIDFMKENVIGVSMKKVILISDFNEEADIISQFQVDAIAEKFLTEKIELVTIGEDSLNERPESSLKISEVFLKDLHKKINGQHITFDSGISSLRFYTEASKKPCPCYFVLELIDKEIPIVSYVKTNVTKFPAWQKAKGDQKVKSKTQYLDRQRTIYSKDEIVAGYKYGKGTFIPVEKELEEAMSYKSGEKSYRIHSFTDRHNINLEYLYDSTTHVILPSTKVKDVTKIFYSLVQAMYKTNTVAIARKVHRNNCAPRMVALFPCVDIPDEPWCLVEIALAFAEDRRVMEIRPIKSAIKQLSSEQNEVIDNLLDSLILPDIEDSYEVDGSQYFLPGCVPDPAVQHRWHMLSFRAINPDKPLPPMENYLKEILEAPLVKERSKCHLQRITQLFQLERTNPNAIKKGEKKREDYMQDNDNIDAKTFDTIEDKADTETDSFKDSVTPMNTSDINLDELAADI